MNISSILRETSKFCARIVFRLLADRRPKPRDPGKHLHILVPRWDGKLGDSIVSSFFFREALRTLNVRITVMTVAELVEMHQLDFAAGQVLVTKANPGILELCTLANRIKRVDVVVHLVGTIRPTEILFLRLLQPTLVFSFDDNLRCVNRKFRGLTSCLDMAGIYKRVLEDLGANDVDGKYIIPLPDSLPSNVRTAQILVNPYASRQDKSLNHDCAVRLLRAIADMYPAFSVGILCSHDTQESAQQIEMAVSRKNVHVVYGLMSPKLLAGVVNQANAIVTVDTAIVHISVGLKKKLVAIYPFVDGVTNPWLPPPSPLTRVIFSEGQYKGTGKKNMNAFSLTELLNSLQELLHSELNSESTLSLKARIVNGLGAAQGTLARQLPLISQEFPEVQNCHPATINLELDSPMTVILPDCRTSPLAWTPSGQTNEIFDLVRIELEFEHFSSRIPAWLYVAHGSPHRCTPYIHEVIAPYIDLGEIGQCRIHVRAGAVSLIPVRTD